MVIEIFLYTLKFAGALAKVSQVGTVGLFDQSNHTSQDFKVFRNLCAPVRGT